MPWHIDRGRKNWAGKSSRGLRNIQKKRCRSYHTCSVATSVAEKKKRGFHRERCAWQVSGSHSARAEPVTAQGRAEIINRGKEASPPPPASARQPQAGGPPATPLATYGSCVTSGCGAQGERCGDPAAVPPAGGAGREVQCWCKAAGSGRSLRPPPVPLQSKRPKKMRQESARCLAACRWKYRAPVKVVCVTATEGDQHKHIYCIEASI